MYILYMYIVDVFTSSPFVIRYYANCRPHQLKLFFFNRALSVFITTISVQKLFQFLKIYPLNVLIIEKYLHFAAEDFSFIIAFVKMKSRKLFNENPHRRKPGKLKWVLR